MKSNTSVEKILELRLMIEPYTAYFAALRITEEELENMHEFSEKLIHRYQKSQNYQDDFDFHLMIARYSGNSLCESLLATLLKQLQNSLYADFNKYSSEKTRKENQSAHMDIIKAITDHNANLAKQLMLNHIQCRLKLINPEYEI